MDKNAVKSFAVESRRQMIESVKYQANLIGVTAEGISEPISKAEGMETYDYGAGTYTLFDEDLQKRENLVKEVKSKGFDNVVEEVAYTWFNRIIAIRYMEVNDYLPTRTRVLSSETEGKLEPDIITEALDLDLNYSNEDRKLVLKLKDENKLDDLFKVLFIKQCNKLNDILPGLFEKTDDYMELLLDISFTDERSIIRKLVDSIPEEDFGEQVEIIGWLYQFYNTELKDETFKNIKKNKVPKERIPAVTQLFTPDWIVKYMVENSLGRLWLEGHPNNELKSKWKYYVEDIKQESNVELDLIKIRNESKNINIEDIKIIDPCMGSGHILVYIFDVLMDIYISEGFTVRDASESILQNNIYGLDIDDRAYQLAYFAVMMRARQYNRTILNKNIIPMLNSIIESNNISDDILEYIASRKEELVDDVKVLINLFKDAKNVGCILKVPPLNFNLIKNQLIDLLNQSYDLKYKSDLITLIDIVNNGQFLSQKYDVVITNPPYMGNTGMNSNLKEFMKINYPLTKSDLFAVFLEKGFHMIREYGFNCMVTMQTWMFLSSFEKFRKELLDNNTIITLLHMDNMVMKIAFGTSATVFRKLKLNDYNSSFFNVKLSDVKNDMVDYSFFNETNPYVANQNKFRKIPGNTIAYWVDDSLIKCFENKNLNSIGSVKQGLATSDNNRFLRRWFEIDKSKIAFDCSDVDEAKKSKMKWFPYNKGGSYCKWYGNHDYVINYENDGLEVKEYAAQLYKTPTRTIKNIDSYFKKSISWSLTNSSYFGVRFYPKGFIFDVNGSSLFVEDKYYYYIGGFLTSKLSDIFLSILNSSMSFQVGNIKNLPIILDESRLNEVNALVKTNIEITKDNWDSYELSWNFIKHPLLRFNEGNISKSYLSWKEFNDKQSNLLKSNELELNNIFSEIYNVNIDCSIEDNDITLNKSNLELDIKSFISYAVGCMFGRYNLDEEGVIFSGGNFKINNYVKFIPDDDNIIPVLDTEYFEDDIVGYFVKFVKTCFGEESLEENLDFIAGTLNKKGKTSREIIRSYFLNDFFKDHSKLYKKRPIYWQFDSGKQNAFKCLIYMHRYEPDLVARVRTDYLHKTQKAIEQNLAHCDNIITNSSNKSEIAKATKDKSKYVKQLDEIKVYDEVLGHMANQNVRIDLDDGVKVNYSKFQNIEISKEGEKTKKVNLLKKI